MSSAVRTDAAAPPTDPAPLIEIVEYPDARAYQRDAQARYAGGWSIDHQSTSSGQFRRGRFLFFGTAAAFTGTTTIVAWRKARPTDFDRRSVEARAKSRRRNHAYIWVDVPRGKSVAGALFWGALTVPTLGAARHKASAAITGTVRRRVDVMHVYMPPTR